VIKPLRIAVLAKQVPSSEALRLRPGGRLDRDGSAAEINPYCRRAIAKGVELARATGGSCTVFTLGPPSAAELLEEAIAWGASGGVLICDPAFAGSDTYATARTLAAAIRRRGPFGMIMAGLHSVDSDTGQVGPQLAELLDLPFLSGVRELTVDGDRVKARCEREDGLVTARLRLPALLTAAERLCEPCKVPPDRRAAARDLAARITVITAASLGQGPWGQAGSPTEVGEVRQAGRERRRVRLAGTLAQQVRRAAELIGESGALTEDSQRLLAVSPTGAAPERIPLSGGDGPVVAVLGEPGEQRVTRQLLGAAAGLAADLGGRTVLLTVRQPDPAVAWSNGADEVVVLGPDIALGLDVPLGPDASHGPGSSKRHDSQRAVQRGPVWGGAINGGAVSAESVAVGAAAWAIPRFRPGVPKRLPWAILAPASAWGREAAARLSVRLDAGLTGDAISLEVRAGRLVCWKPAFGTAVAAVTARSEVQMATVRPGVLPLRARREGGGVAVMRTCRAMPPERVTITGRMIDDDPERLVLARVVVGAGHGVDPARYGELRPLLDLLDAELAGTRKVTDAGWLPRGRQVGLTGRMISPALYLLLGSSGKINHMIASRGAGLIVAVNTDPAAPVFDTADIGITGDWAEAARLLVGELAARLPHLQARAIHPREALT